MRILITGGCGFLGSNLAQDALQRGDEVAVFDSLSREGSRDNLVWLKSLGGSLEFVHGDIRSRDQVDAVVEQVRPEAVFHVCGQVAMTTSIASPRLDFEVNAMGSFNLLEAVRRFVPEAAILYSSTNKVYGDLEQYQYEETDTRYRCIDFPNGFDESVPLDFQSPYGCSKGAADQYFVDYHRVFGLKTVVFRHSSMYGGRQFATFDQGWIGWFCRQALEAQADPAFHFRIAGTGKQVRDVLHADDMKRLYHAAVERADQIAGEVFNIGGGMDQSLSLIELFDQLERMLGVELRYDNGPPRHSDQRVFVAGLSKAQQRLGWLPRVTVEQGLASMVDWYRALV